MAPRSRQFIPALRFESLTRIYDPVVALTTREQGFKRRLLEHARVKDGESVLDLACGTGTLAIAVKMDVPKAKLSAIDADARILRPAQKKADDAGVKIGRSPALSTEMPY